MKIANLILLAACFTVAGCSASNYVATSNSSTTQPATAKTTAANSNAANTSAAQEAAPERIVKDLYTQHDAKKSPFFQTKDRAVVDRYFTKELADLIWKDAVNSKGEVGALGADPLYDAQDTKITDFKVQPDQVDGDRARVLVTFKNFGKEKSLIFNLERENGVWKISNITGDDYNLKNALQGAG